MQGELGGVAPRCVPGGGRGALTPPGSPWPTASNTASFFLPLVEVDRPLVPAFRRQTRRPVLADFAPGHAELVAVHRVDAWLRLAEVLLMRAVFPGRIDSVRHVRRPGARLPREV